MNGYGNHFGAWNLWRPGLGLLFFLAAIGRVGAAEPLPTDPQDPNHWSFVAPAQVKVPAVRESERSSLRNPVDAFIQHRLEQAGIQPGPEADRSTLIRRIWFDLAGIPPSPDQVRRLGEFTGPEAWERVTDRLLAHPAYGQRAARGWLDLVRYADSDGYKADVYRPQSWRYRDYVIGALNSDKGYDRFIQEQLAGDEIFPGDSQAMAATGYLRQWPYEDNQANVAVQWRTILDDMTQNASEVFMGLGIGCAHCHDHKYDPILQKDYYRLQAFFAPFMPRTQAIPSAPGQWEPYREQLRRWQEATATIRARMEEIKAPHVQAMRKDAIERYPAYLQVMYAKTPDQRSDLEKQLVHLADIQTATRSGAFLDRIKGDQRKEWDELDKELKAQEGLKPAPMPEVLTVTDVGPVGPPTYIPGSRQNVEAGFLTLLDPAPALVKPLPQSPGTSGRRAALAMWLTAPGNPLTGRVMVNRLWQSHFGVGIVATANDFGRQGSRPTHPELLDWLAGTLPRQGWSLKKMHRLMVTSSAYRRASVTDPSPQALRADPSNDLLWRMRVRRMDGEQIRDAILESCAELESRMGGPGVDGAQRRRSIYLKNIRNVPEEILGAFDGPDMFNSCSRRNVTTTPLQSLLMINGSWTLQRSREMARRLELHEVQEVQEVQAPGGMDERLTLAYRLVLGRGPAPEELNEARKFMLAPGSPKELLEDFCHALLNANAFIYID